ncbi:MAG: hypothetical protein KKA73_14325 [Chloroflexi bacterium]|nr:hypothetical protein [Chloroflexota bacterium]MBU1748862.1 hypothetical protein [Chloroflexota bacterium]MBU1880179.1 hypothetical protein [Chloroflexota bacterium]
MNINQRLARVVPTALTLDAATLSERDQQSFKRLVAASDLLNEVYLRQMGPEVPALRDRLAVSADDEGRAAYRYLQIQNTAWDRLDDNAPFADTGPWPPGAGYYPPDLTADEFNAWLADHPADREAFESYFTVIRRDGDRLVAIPYSEAYAEWLKPAARLLAEAADFIDNESEATYLRSRAAALRSNDYIQSDIDWMDVHDNAIEVVFGPYEVYADRLMGYKAAFQSYLTLRDQAASAALADWAARLPALDEHLAELAGYPRPHRGAASPISVVNEVYAAGWGRKCPPSTAFALPNDERVRALKGSKKVMLRNVGQAKFERLTRPLAERVLADDQLPLLSFDASFETVLLHELAHGLGPAQTTLPDGRQVTVGVALRDLYSALEEAKATVVGIYCAQVLTDQGVLSPELEVSRAVASLVGSFRAIRVGATYVYATASAIEYNFLYEAGAFGYSATTGRFRVDPDRLRAGYRDLARELLAVEAAGDYDRARAFLARYGQLPPAILQALEHVGEVPMDIAPSFPVVELIGQ